MDEVCPRCKTTKYRNPAMKLMVNSCGHALCDTCVELLFIKGSAACPECGIPLRRSGFRVQLFEDPTVEKEMEIRRKIMKDYTKKEVDFKSLREYNDYLEEVETIVFNLVNNIDITETKRQIEVYKKENEEQILKSKNFLSPEMLELERILESERMLAEQRQFELQLLEKEEKLRKIKTKEALIDDLMFSDVDAQSIVTSHKVSADAANATRQEKERDILKALRTTTVRTGQDGVSSESLNFSSGIKIGVGSGSHNFSSGINNSSSTFLAIPKATEGPLYVFREYDMDLGGPRIPSDFELSQNNYLANVKIASAAERAAGYNSIYACQRAIKDAFSCIRIRTPEVSISLTKDALKKALNAPLSPSVLDDMIF